MKLFLRSSALLTALLLTAPAYAATFRGGENLVINEAVSDDVYAGGGTITATSAIDGDAVLAGGEVILREPVEEDVIIAAGRIEINGSVGDDARLAGGDIRLNGSVADDAFLFAGTVHTAEGSTIGGDLGVTGGDLYLRGIVDGNATVKAGRVTFDGTVNGTLHVEADEIVLNGTLNGLATLSANRIVVGETAVLNGDVRYWSVNETDFSAATVNGELMVDESLKRDVVSEKQVAGVLAAGFVASFVYSVLFTLILILIVGAVTRTMLAESALELREKFWMSMLYGFLYFVLTPIICGLLFMTIIGIPFALILAAIYAFTLFCAKAITAMVFARWIQLSKDKKLLKKGGAYWAFVGWSLLIFVGLKLLGMIPLLGWVASIVLIWAAFGAVMMVKWRKFQIIR